LRDGSLQRSAGFALKRTAALSKDGSMILDEGRETFLCFRACNLEQATPNCSSKDGSTISKGGFFKAASGFLLLSAQRLFRRTGLWSWTKYQGRFPQGVMRCEDLRMILIFRPLPSHL
jgi:hypothetical protein